MGTTLEDGSRVGIVGGGPAGSLTAYFLLTFARRLDLQLAVDIYEPRDYTKPGPGGCNMCGGIVSESLVQALALEGINLPSTVVQRGIDSYILHTDDDRVRIETPLHEKRIAAVHRGAGPRDAGELRWTSFDGHLLGLAREMGANVVQARVTDLGWDGERPQVRLKDSAQTYDLLVGATGVNSTAWQMYERVGFKGRKPTTTKTFITELHMGAETITRLFGTSMHMFLIDVPRLDFAAIIPKGDFITVCMLGEEIDDELVRMYLTHPAVLSCFPADSPPTPGACHCSPKINMREAEDGFIDRVVLVGDCGVSRLYKDGIGAAYRTAKAAARTAIFSGVSATDFRKHYVPAYRTIARDNVYGKFIFWVVHQSRRVPPVIGGVMGATKYEQARAAAAKRMSMVLWDMFTGSAPYRDVFLRTLDPKFILRLLWESARALVGRRRREEERPWNLAH